jgi:hypothetical protein
VKKEIKIVPHHLINKSEWDNAVAHSFNGLVYAYSWYLDIVSPQWDALIMGNYEMIMPITHKKRFTIPYLCQPAFTQQLGVFSIKLLSAADVLLFLKSIPAAYKLIEISLNSLNKLEDSEFEKTINITTHLPLIQDYPTLYANYSEQIKRNLKKAAKFNLSVSWQADVLKIIELFRANKGKEIETYKTKEYTMLQKIMDYAIKHHLGFAIGVNNAEGECIAGAFFIQSNGKLIFIFSATNAESKSTGAMALLINEMIKANAGKNIILDFEGSNNQNLSRFYQGFGAQKINYYSIKKNNLPPIVKWLK